MAIFSKNKNENSGEDSLDNKKDLKLRKNLRDLEPKNKKKRKEPPKPWGKKERWSVLILLVITTLVSGMFAFSARENKLPDLPRFGIDLSNFNLKNPFGESIIEIGQPGHFAENDEKAKQAVDLFDKEIKPLSGLYGFYVIRLDDGSSYGVSDNEQFQGASLLKLPLLALFYKEAEEGKINLETTYILKSSDKVKGSGALDLAKPGTSYSYRQLAELMAKDSDRTAYKIIKNIVGDVAFEDFLKSQGLDNTDIATGNTTPKDMGTILNNLYLDKVVSDKSKEEIFSFLTNTIYEKWITAGVPNGVKVIHKFGQDAGVLADAGIVLGPRPYILVIISNGITQSDADRVFPAISKDVYNIENNVE